MFATVAQPVQALEMFSAIIDRRNASVPTNWEVSSRGETNTVSPARAAKGRSRPSFLTTLLRSFAAFAA